MDRNVKSLKYYLQLVFMKCVVTRRYICNSQGKDIVSYLFKPLCFLKGVQTKFFDGKVLLLCKVSRKCLASFV